MTLLIIALLSTALKLGVQTPGVQIPMAKLKAESTENTPDLNGSCAKKQRGLGSDWSLNCSDGVLSRLDTKTGQASKTLKTGAAAVRGGLAVSSDSVWVLADEKTTLSRIDPLENKIVAEVRLPAGCNSMVFGETSLWVTCPSENRVLRIDPLLNVVKERIEVSPEPFAIAVGEGSIWTYSKKDSKVERIDPKTNKVSKTIELGVPKVEGDIIVAEGSVWVSLPGFPISRIDPKTEKVVQQFVGDGGGLIEAAPGTIFLKNVKESTTWKLDPRRILATLAE